MRSMKLGMPRPGDVYEFNATRFLVVGAPQRTEDPWNAGAGDTYLVKVVGPSGVRTMTWDRWANLHWRFLCGPGNAEP